MIFGSGPSSEVKKKAKAYLESMIAKKTLPQDVQSGKASRYYQVNLEYNGIKQVEIYGLTSVGKKGVRNFGWVLLGFDDYGISRHNIDIQPKGNGKVGLVNGLPFRRGTKYHGHRNINGNAWMLPVVTTDYDGNLVYDDWCLGDMGVAPYESPTEPGAGGTSRTTPWPWLISTSEYGRWI